MNEQIIDKIVLPEGMTVDLNEGWRKIISRQFGGNPGRGFGELIQNLIDSYSSDVAMEDRKGKIETGPDWIAATDYGSGLDRNKIQLVVTLGGTDKSGDVDKIGHFGMGLFSIFNPKLKTKRVEVTTICEGELVELIFNVTEPEAPPEITYRLLDTALEYSTCIRVYFDSSNSVRRCLKAVENTLEYYPCRITINGKPYPSIWEKARERNNYSFTEDSVTGFLTHRNTSWFSLDLMCKYERLWKMPMGSFMVSSNKTTTTLEDLSSESMPYLPGTTVYANCNDLRVTIARDAYYLDYQWGVMKSNLSRAMRKYLGAYLITHNRDQIKIANMYTLKNFIKYYLENPESEDNYEGVKLLAEARVFTVIGKKKMVSLAELYKMQNKELPFYYSVTQSNLHWLGGRFKHDFIVIPPQSEHESEIPSFWDSVFYAVFKDTVNLDTIQKYQNKLEDLIERGIIDKDTLSPSCQIVGDWSMKRNEKDFLKEISRILAHDAVRISIADNLAIPVKSITPVFIKIENGNAMISSGILDESGKPLDQNVISNLKQNEDTGPPVKPVKLLLGLTLDHAFMQRLLASKDKHRGYYSLTYIAHELALSQQLLVPYSSFFHLAKEKLANALRLAMVDEVSGENKAA